MNTLRMNILIFTIAAQQAVAQATTPPPAPPAALPAPQVAAVPPLAPLPPLPSIEGIVEGIPGGIEEGIFGLAGPGAIAPPRFEYSFEPMMLAQRAPRPAATPTPPRPPGFNEMDFGRDMERWGRDSEDRVYRRGSEYLDKRDWEKAVAAFDAVIEKKGNKADGAYYWKAYAQSRLGRRDDAIVSLAQLEKMHPSSRWLNDAKALQVEVKQASGQPVSPEAQSDEDLKLLAINSLINSDPERAVPLLEGLLKKNTSPRLKERALFVLAQSNTPKAREIVVQIAKGGANPDLQAKAVEYLGVYRGKENTDLMAEIYRSTNDNAIKRRVLNGYMMAKDREKLLAVAKTEPNQDLRREAIHWLGVSGAQNELSQLYSSEQAPEVRREILQAMFISGNIEKVIEIARAEKDLNVRRHAIHTLGLMKKPQSTDALVSLYGSETDRDIRRQILNAFFMQGSAQKLVEVAKKETDPDLRREAVQKLSMMKSKEATDFMMELLNK